MNTGPQHPSGGQGGHHGGRRRRRRGRGGAPNRPNGQPGQHQHGQGHGGGRNRQAFTGPMDHSYRNQQGNDNGQRQRGPMGRRGMPAPARFFQHQEVEPLPPGHNGAPKIYAFIDDLFFVAKIQETARKLNVKVEFVKTGEELFEKLDQNGNGNPSLIIFDLNSNTSKPLTLIPKLKSRLKKDTNIIGFVSHVQGDLKLKAQEAGCDMVMPRSAFSSNLPQLLRRHAASEMDLEQ